MKIYYSKYNCIKCTKKLNPQGDFSPADFFVGSAGLELNTCSDGGQWLPARTMETIARTR